MRNMRGAVLGITIGFMVFFTLMGMGAIYLSGGAGKNSVDFANSSQALWAAEAGLQWSQAGILGHNPGVYPNNVLPTGTFDVTIAIPQGKPWAITSSGHPISNTALTRNLYALIAYPGLINAVSTTGTLATGDATIVGSVVQNQTPVTFQSIFGFDLGTAKTRANTINHYYIINATNPVVSSITYVEPNDDPIFTGFVINDPNWVGSGLLIVSGGTLRMSAGTFNGIIWIENGNLSIIGSNASIIGTVYINGALSMTTFSSRSHITFDQGMVNSVMMTQASTQKPLVTCWSEVSGTCF